MKKITIRELHMKTGKWVREAAQASILVSDRGRPIATLGPIESDHVRPSFADRKLLDAFAKLGRTPGELTHLISEDRDRA